VAWVLREMGLKDGTSGVGAAVAAVVGLVAITPAAGFVTPLSSAVIGSLAALVCYAALQLLGRTRLDDRLDVFACHGVGGIVGALLTGVFATTSVNPAGADGLLYGNANLLAVQLASVGATAALAALGTAGILLTLRWVTGLLPAQLGEARGMDAIEHGEVAYALGTASLRWQRPSVNSSPVSAR